MALFVVIWTCAVTSGQMRSHSKWFWMDLGKKLVKNWNPRNIPRRSRLPHVPPKCVTIPCIWFIIPVPDWVWLNSVAGAEHVTQQNEIQTNKTSRAAKRTIQQDCTCENQRLEEEAKTESWRLALQQHCGLGFMDTPDHSCKTVHKKQSAQQLIQSSYIHVPTWASYIAGYWAAFVDHEINSGRAYRTFSLHKQDHDPGR